MFGEQAFGKTLKQGINGKIITVIHIMYKQIKSCITVNGSTSGFFNCEKGVRQGENLSPLLFAIYLNDLESFRSFNNCSGIDIDIQEENLMIFIKHFVILYADDTILLSDNAKQFQETLNIFYEYCKNWKFNINIEKKLK